MSTDHAYYMSLAIAAAEQAALQDEVPVGAVIVKAGQVIATAYNTREQDHDPTAHAELLAIRRATTALQDWRLEECTLYVTLEPCPMCAGAILQARLPIVVFGARDPKAGAVTSLFELLNDPRLNHRCQVIGDILAEPCGQLLTRFFQQKRALGKK
jgi:tRNA(adenine34) deaminase